MGKEKEDLLREQFHAMNNWLNKITVTAGQARYELELKGLSPEKLEEEKQKFIKIFDDLEEHALKIGKALRSLHKDILPGV